ncbi:hypothetical protein CDAR_411971 [Caerostris darwini]|uniref:Uncharacterized protein n=1 Tax=Caerostris darwini TaxID=1538125 RepID=A0AAV4WCZ1_9ARAC|nr:hypothetical protein CDAR_411971 [Caerostris darwini]
MKRRKQRMVTSPMTFDKCRHHSLKEFSQIWRELLGPEYWGGQGLQALAAAEGERSANRRMKILCILITQASQPTEQPNSRRQGRQGITLARDDFTLETVDGRACLCEKKSCQVIFVIQRVDCAEDGFVLGEKKTKPRVSASDETAYKSLQNELWPRGDVPQQKGAFPRVRSLLYSS